MACVAGRASWALGVIACVSFPSIARAELVPEEIRGIWSQDCEDPSSAKVTIEPPVVTIVVEKQRDVYEGVEVSRTWYGGVKASGDTIWLPTSKAPGQKLELVVAATRGKNGFLMLEEGHPDFGRDIRQVFGRKFQRCAAQAGGPDSRSPAQALDVPVVEQGGDGQMATCASSTVAGLKAGGDGFLAVRAGPGTHYRKLDELRNGDVVLVYEIRGKWAGVAYRAMAANCAATRTRFVPHEHKGWVHTNWLKDIAG